MLAWRTRSEPRYYVKVEGGGRSDDYQSLVRRVILMSFPSRIYVTIMMQTDVYPSCQREL